MIDWGGQFELKYRLLILINIRAESPEKIILLSIKCKKTIKYILIRKYHYILGFWKSVQFGIFSALYIDVCIHEKVFVVGKITILPTSSCRHTLDTQWVLSAYPKCSTLSKFQGLYQQCESRINCSMYPQMSSRFFRPTKTKTKKLPQKYVYSNFLILVLFFCMNELWHAL